MRVLKLLGVGAVVAVAAFIAVGFVLPNRWQVERRTTIGAPAAVVYARVVDLEEWPKWAAISLRTDTHARFTFEGPARAVGATIAWDGPRLGRGRYAITALEPGAHVELEGAIESAHPNARTTVDLEEQGGQTTVRWRDEGASPPIVGGYMRTFVEDALGARHDAALAALRTLCEQDVARGTGAAPSVSSPAPPPPSQATPAIVAGSAP